MEENEEIYIKEEIEFKEEKFLFGIVEEVKKEIKIKEKEIKQEPFQVEVKDGLFYADSENIATSHIAKISDDSSSRQNPNKDFGLTIYRENWYATSPQNLEGINAMEYINELTTKNSLTREASIKKDLDLSKGQISLSSHVSVMKKYMLASSPAREDCERLTLCNFDVKSFVCQICNKSFKHRSSLTAHKLSHSEKRPFICEICDKSFKSKENLKQHLTYHSVGKPFPCEICEKPFKTKDCKKRHMISHSKMQPYVCEICEKLFKEKRNKTKHMRCHLELKLSVSNKPASVEHSENFQLKDGKRSFVCKICDKSFNYRSSLTAHKLSHTEERPFVCKICDKPFKSKINLKNHIPYHSNEKLFVCDICEKPFKTKDSRRRHMKCHSEIQPIVSNSPTTVEYIENSQLKDCKKPFVCEICEKSFKVKRSLRYHMICHSGLKPFVCDVCNKSFIAKHVLERHLSLHTNEKPFVCKICDKAFRHNFSLKAHKVFHSKDKPFVCKICNKDFKWNSNLKKHMRSCHSI